MLDHTPRNTPLARECQPRFRFPRNPFVLIRPAIICARRRARASGAERALRLASLAVLLCLPGCFKVDSSDLQITTHVKNPVIGMKASSLVTTVTGSFDFTVTIGDLSKEKAVFSDAPSFELVTESGASITPLDAVAEDDPFPLTLTPGKAATVSFTLSDKNTLSSEQVATLCSGPVAVVATLADSSGGRPTQAESTAVQPGGCF
jgi:hypothetical protein